MDYVSRFSRRGGRINIPSPFMKMEFKPSKFIVQG